ncbi:MAG: hypothetical protein U1D25_13730 [Hydrogenophaga sp.]|nr:hypothetical protein [Hydrogenophaga sp.]
MLAGDASEYTTGVGQDNPAERLEFIGVNGKSIPITQSKLDLVHCIASNLNKGVQP